MTTTEGALDELRATFERLTEVFLREPTPEEMALIVLDGLGYNLERIGQVRAVLEDGVLSIKCTYQYPVTADYIKINLTLPEGEE